jgi:hypothetical protein
MMLYVQKRSTLVRRENMYSRTLCIRVRYVGEEEDYVSPDVLELRRCVGAKRRRCRAVSVFTTKVDWEVCLQERLGHYL